MMFLGDQQFSNITSERKKTDEILLKFEILNKNRGKINKLICKKKILKIKE